MIYKQSNALTTNLKAAAYQYQIERFGRYRPQKPLTRAIASRAKTAAS